MRKPGSPARTSMTWRPIEPVEPRSATPRTGPAAGLAEDGDDIEEGDRRREQEGIDPIEEAAVARDEPARLLRARRSLQHRLGQVAGLRRARDENAEDRAGEHGPPERGEKDRAHDQARHEPAADALERLRRRDMVHERGPAEAASHEVRRG